MKRIGIKCGFCGREYNPEKNEKNEKDTIVYVKSEITGEYICSGCIILFSELNRLDITVH